MKRRYSPDQIRFLTENAKGRSFRDLRGMFNLRFKTDLSLKELKNACSYYKIRNGLSRRPYTAGEIRFLRENSEGRSRLETAEMFNKRFSPGITAKQLASAAFKRGLPGGRGRRGIPPANRLPPGTERVSGGYVEVKTPGGAWKRKHAAIREAACGKTPEGCAVIFADGDRRNFALENLLLVSRKELAVMNKNGLIFKRGDLTGAGRQVARLKLLTAERKKKPGGKAAGR